MHAKDKKNKKYDLSSVKSALDYMPHDKNTLRVLHERAELIAKKAILKVQKEETAIYIRFRLGPNETYGIPYQYSKEVLDHIMMTKLPCVPKFIAGVINHRGSLIAVLNLKEFFYHQQTEYNTKSSIIIVSTNHITAGILVDNIDDNAIYDPNQLDTTFPINSSLKPEFIIGLDQGKTAIINVETILADLQLQSNKLKAT